MSLRLSDVQEAWLKVFGLGPGKGHPVARLSFEMRPKDFPTLGVHYYVVGAPKGHELEQALIKVTDQPYTPRKWGPEAPLPDNLSTAERVELAQLRLRCWLDGRAAHHIACTRSRLADQERDRLKRLSDAGEDWHDIYRRLRGYLANTDYAIRCAPRGYYNLWSSHVSY